MLGAGRLDGSGLVCVLMLVVVSRHGGMSEQLGLAEKAFIVTQ